MITGVSSSTPTENRTLELLPRSQTRETETGGGWRGREMRKIQITMAAEGAGLKRFYDYGNKKSEPVSEPACELSSETRKPDDSLITPNLPIVARPRSCRCCGACHCAVIRGGSLVLSPPPLQGDPSSCLQPPVDFFLLFHQLIGCYCSCPGRKAEHLRSKSTGNFNQPDWSPCNRIASVSNFSQIVF